MNKKYYAVRSGRKIGVFDTWDECNAQVKGYKGAIYKSFKTMEEATAFVKNEELLPVDSSEIGKDEVIAYVDGSFNISTGKFGYGIVLIDSENETELNGSLFDEELQNQRNVAGEVFGAMKAIQKAIELNKKIIYIHFDYMGIQAWADGEWKTNISLTKDYKKFIDESKEQIEIKFVKVKAHSNDKYNDLADKLAKEAVGII